VFFCTYFKFDCEKKELKVPGNTLNQIRESIKYVRRHESIMIKFKQCIKKVCDIDASSALSIDVPIR